MGGRNLWRQAGTLAALGGMLAGAVPVLAEGPAAPAGAPVATGAAAAIPIRLGRLARISGTVSFHPDGAERWEPALANLPVGDGAAFWTEPAAEAEIEFATSHFVMDQSTELDFDSIETLAVNAILPQGHVYLRLRGLAAGEQVRVQTPRGSVRIDVDGQYGIFAGDTENPTRVTVLAGAAQVSGPNVDLHLTPGQTGLIEGQDDFAGRTVPTPDDPFLTAQAARERPVAAQAAPLAPGSTPRGAVNPRRPVGRSVGTARQVGSAVPARTATAPPPAVAQMSGGQDLNTQGTWVESPRHGRVWYPPVEPGWRPYRDGRWVWLGRRGWTWVDNAPWGFAPFQYGRWVMLNGRWAWWPAGAPVAGRPAIGLSQAEARRMNIVLPPPREMAAARPPAPAPGPILFRPTPRMLANGAPPLAPPPRLVIPPPTQAQ